MNQLFPLSNSKIQKKQKAKGLRPFKCVPKPDLQLTSRCPQADDLQLLNHPSLDRFSVNDAPERCPFQKQWPRALGVCCSSMSLNTYIHMLVGKDEVTARLHCTKKERIQTLSRWRRDPTWSGGRGWIVDSCRWSWSGGGGQVVDSSL